jgi:hypothetical protein
MLSANVAFYRRLFPMPSKEQPTTVRLELLKRDRANLKEILSHSTARHKAPTIRSVLRQYAHLLKQQDNAAKQGRRLRLVEVDDSGGQQTVVEHLNLDL